MISTEFSEGLERLPLGIIQLGRHLDFELHVKIPLGMALEAGHAVSFDPEITPPLRSCRDLHSHGSRKGRNLDLTTQRSSHEWDGHTAVKIGAISREDGMLLQMNHDIEVTRAATPTPGLAAT